MVCRWSFQRRLGTAAVPEDLQEDTLKTFDNNGKLISEINNSLTSDGKAINSQTTYNNGRPVTQVVSVRDSQGKVTTTTVLNGKIIP